MKSENSMVFVVAVKNKTIYLGGGEIWARDPND